MAGSTSWSTTPGLEPRLPGGRFLDPRDNTAALADPSAPEHFYPGIAYPTSKATLNMLTVQYAKAFPHLRINAVDPGFTVTDLN